MRWYIGGKTGFNRGHSGIRWWLWVILASIHATQWGWYRFLNLNFMPSTWSLSCDKSAIWSRWCHISCGSSLHRISLNPATRHGLDVVEVGVEASLSSSGCDELINLSCKTYNPPGVRRAYLMISLSQMCGRIFANTLSGTLNADSLLNIQVTSWSWQSCPTDSRLNLKCLSKTCANSDTRILALPRMCWVYAPNWVYVNIGVECLGCLCISLYGNVCMELPVQDGVYEIKWYPASDPAKCL